MLLEIKDGTISRSGEIILEHFDFEIRGTEKIGIVGRNGAGKTSLLEVLAGIRSLDPNEKNQAAGLFHARKFTVGMLGQTGPGDPERTVAETILSGTIAEENAFLTEAQEDFEQRFDRLFTRLGFAKEDKQKRIGDFSGGEQKKILLIRLFLLCPEVLILDEPTNHLDMEAIRWLESAVRSYPYAVVTVSHDRYLLDRTAEVIYEAAGRHMIRYPGNYTAYRELKARTYQKQLKAWEKRQEEIRHTKELIEKFRHKPKKAAFARSRRHMLEKMEPLPMPQKDEAFIHTADILPARPGNKWVLACEHLKFGYDRELAEISFRIRKGQKIGILGPNGAGKSAFVQTAAGRIPAISGHVNMGFMVDAAYFDQFSADLHADKSVIDWFHDQYPSLTEKEIRDVLAGYLFHGRDMGKPVSELSGGEKSRLMLASLLEKRPNFLILDEPTNNMDIPARETLESLFRAYKGTILFVSHDRYFLDRVADSLLVFENGRVMYYPFGYSHYEERREKLRAGEDVAAIRTAEEQRLIEGLRQVPKAERHRIKELSTEDASKDWEFGLNRESRLKAETVFRTAEEAARQSVEEEWIAFAAGKNEKASGLEAGDRSVLTEHLEAERARALQEWTEECIRWYDIFERYDGVPGLNRETT